NGSGTYSGAFFGNSRVRIRDFTDGTSNTILVGEQTTFTPSGTTRRAKIWAGMEDATTVTSGSTSSFHVDAVTNTGAAYLINANTGTSGEDAFSSMHVGGCHFLLGDGRVRFISENIDSLNYQRLGGKADGEPNAEF
ncbi:hypothetical protein-transmembrane region and signal peptide prediction, partial [hydrothermal vent metagenome]